MIQQDPQPTLWERFVQALTEPSVVDSNPLTFFDFSLVLVLTFGLTLVVAQIYRLTHKGISYSQSTVQTFVIMGVVVGLIMMIIGTNIAQAFTLVGALSIVRFRNAVKDSRDVGFVFWAMAIGMACGTKHYGAAILATFAIAAFVFVMFHFDMFARVVRERILLVEVPVDLDYDQALGELFNRNFTEHFLISMETLPGNETMQLAFSVNTGRRFESAAFLQEVRRITGERKVSLIEGQQQMDL